MGPLEVRVHWHWGRTIGALGGPDSLSPGADNKALGCPSSLAPGVDDWGPWRSGFVGAGGGQLSLWIFGFVGAGWKQYCVLFCPWDIFRFSGMPKLYKQHCFHKFKNVDIRRWKYTLNSAHCTSLNLTNFASSLCHITMIIPGKTFRRRKILENFSPIILGILLPNLTIFYPIREKNPNLT